MKRFIILLLPLFLFGCAQTTTTGQNSPQQAIGEACSIGMDIADVIDTLVQEKALDQKTIDSLKEVSPIINAVCKNDGSFPIGSLQDISSRVVPLVRVAIQISPLNDSQKQISLIAITLIEKRLNRLIPQLQAMNTAVAK
jgi:hypothetical protein